MDRGVHVSVKVDRMVTACAVAASDVGGVIHGLFCLAAEADVRLGLSAASAWRPVSVVGGGRGRVADVEHIKNWSAASTATWATSNVLINWKLRLREDINWAHDETLFTYPDRHGCFSGTTPRQRCAGYEHWTGDGWNTLPYAGMKVYLEAYSVQLRAGGSSFRDVGGADAQSDRITCCRTAQHRAMQVQEVRIMLEHLLGPMLGSEFVRVHGEVLEWHHSDGFTTHKFWGARNGCWRDEQTNGITHVTTPTGSATLHDGAVLDAISRKTAPGYHLPDKLLRPLYAPIWGRLSDDWRVDSHTDRVTIDGNEYAHIPLVRREHPDSAGGFIRVDPKSGRIWDFNTPTRRWQLLWVDDHFTDPEEALFSYPM